jgi:hypothetical protein
MAENFIRTKQINSSDLSGFVQNIITENEYQITYGGGTGININNIGQITVSGTDIYLIDSVFNVSGTGVFNALDLNNIDNLSLSGVDINIQGANVTLGQNLNILGDLNVSGTIRYNQIVDTTITGNLSGYTGIFVTVFGNNLVYNTGNQTISGIKTFASGISVVGGNMTLSGNSVLTGVNLSDYATKSLAIAYSIAL